MAPRELWQVNLSNGSCVRATLVPGPRRHCVVWYRDERLEGAAEFANVEQALALANRLRSSVAEETPLALGSGSVRRR